MLALLLLLGTEAPAVAQCRLEIRVNGFRKRKVCLGLYRQQEGVSGTIAKAFMHEKNGASCQRGSGVSSF